jgi:hypothetical protein
VLVVAHQPARQRQGDNHRVPERAAGIELGADMLEPGAELDEAITRRLGWHSLQRAGVRAGSDQVAAVVLARPSDQPVRAGDTDAAARRCDRAAERLRVGRVLHQGQVGERVTNLGALVQAERAEHAVRNPGVRERALQGLGRVPGPREREDLARRRARGQRVGDLAGDPVRLLVLVDEHRDPDLAAGAAHRDQCLGRPVLVVADASDRRLEDLRAWAEVAPQHDPRVIGMPLGEAEDVAGVGVPPAVDQLVIVAAHA